MGGGVVRTSRSKGVRLPLCACRQSSSRGSCSTLNVAPFLKPLASTKSWTQGPGHPHVRLDINFEGRQLETARQYVEVSSFSLLGGRKSGLVGAMGTTQDFPEEKVSREVR